MNKQKKIEELENQITEMQEELEALKRPEPMFGQALTLDDANRVLYIGGNHINCRGNYISTLNQGGYFISQEAAELEVEKKETTPTRP